MGTKNLSIVCIDFKRQIFLMVKEYGVDYQLGFLALGNI